MWSKLAQAVAPLLLHKLHSITIVNASGIVPTGAPERATFTDIMTGRARHDLHETKFRVQLYDVLVEGHTIGPDSAKEQVRRVKFQYMWEWVRTAHWEDVFSGKEMKPWLNFEQQSFLTHYFEPVDPDASKWNKDMKEAVRYNERFQRKQTWTYSSFRRTASSSAS